MFTTSTLSLLDPLSCIELLRYFRCGDLLKQSCGNDVAIGRLDMGGGRLSSLLDILRFPIPAVRS